MGVAQALLKEDLSHIALQLHSKTAHDVERAMASHSRTLDDFMALVSPAVTCFESDTLFQS